jgi:adenosylcobinamide-phosphate synthase
VSALLLGFLLDQLLGDPPGWPHPVRWLGRLIQLLEPILRRLLPERFGGIVLLLLVTGTAGGAVWGVLELAAACHPLVRLAVATLLVYYGLAARSLARETQAVLVPCQQEDWTEARRRLSGIVGRDTQDLPPEEIYRACIETVAENTTDAVVAPLLYAALLGPVGLWVLKAISTLDSMVGYRNTRYLRFGWASARLDDVANFVPARLTWLLLSLAAPLTGGYGWQALRIGWRDGRKHPSPNSAWGEATMAGALDVQLGGPSTYQGVASEKLRLGDPGEALSADKVRQAIRLMLVTAWLTLTLTESVLLIRSGDLEPVYSIQIFIKRHRCGKMTIPLLKCRIQKNLRKQVGALKKCDILGVSLPYNVIQGCSGWKPTTTGGPMSLTGTHFVRVLRSALQSAKYFWPQVGPRMEIRRNALKLRHWGSRDSQTVMGFDLRRHQGDAWLRGF